MTDDHPDSHGAPASTTFSPVSVLETILYFVVPTVGLYGLIVALVVAPRMANRRRHRAGDTWSYQPLFWIANPEGAPLPPVDDDHRGPRAGAERGGARGNW